MAQTDRARLATAHKTEDLGAFTIEAGAVIDVHRGLQSLRQQPCGVRLLAMPERPARPLGERDGAVELVGRVRVPLDGSPDRRAGYLPSPQTPPQLLFMGPFRYAQNREGIVEFLDTAWPKLKTQFPDLRITILGGVESAALVAIDARLRQDGVETISAFVDPAAYLQNCTLSINPQNAIRGSSIKLIESLLAGRVCVSTADGTRGFGDAGFDDLVVAPTIAAMAEPIAALIADPARRRRLERADDVKLDRYTWDAIASQQFGLYQRLIGKR